MTSLRLERADQDYHANAQIISLLGFDLIFSGGRTRVDGMACSVCDATEIRETGESPITQLPGVYPRRPSRFQCLACGADLGTISQLFDRYAPKD